MKCARSSAQRHPVSLPKEKVAEGYLLQFESLAAEAFETTNTNRDSSATGSFRHHKS